jgi:hypothetical protein
VLYKQAREQGGGAAVITNPVVITNPLLQQRPFDPFMRENLS